MARPSPVPPSPPGMASRGGSGRRPDPVRLAGCRGPRRARPGPGCRAAAPPPGPHGDPAAGRAVLDRVVHQVGHHLVQPLAVRVGGQLGRRDVQVQVDVRARPGRASRPPRCPPCPGSRSSAPPTGRATPRTAWRPAGTAPLSSRDRSSSWLTSLPSRSVCCEGQPHRLRVGGGHAVHHVLQHRPQRGDRGAQLVRDIRHQLLAVPVGGGQVGGHPVEGLGQFADLVPAHAARTRRL